MTPRWQLPLIVLFVVSIASSSYSQSKAGIAGTVTDKIEHAPIGNTFVLVHVTGGTDVHVRTDAKGTYTVQLSPGIYDVFFSAQGFSPTCRKIEVQANTRVTFNAVLEASSAGMQETSGK